MTGEKRPSEMTSDLHRNPFLLIGATTRDNRQRIVELAESKALELDPEICQRARTELTNPRARLKAEVGWLPGVAPRKAQQLIFALNTDPLSVGDEINLPTLAFLNLFCAAIEAKGGLNSLQQVSTAIEKVVRLVEDLDANQVLRDINEDRSVSGIPQVSNLDVVESELSDRSRYFRNVLKSALDQLTPEHLVSAITSVVQNLTAGGSNHPPRLLDDIVDSYALEARDFLQKEAANIDRLIAAARPAAASGRGKVNPIVDQIVTVAKNWDKVAQPIQLIAMAKGTAHQESRDVAYKIRDLAIDLFNDHDLLAEAKQLTVLLQEVFSELPDILEKVEIDSEALENIAQRRQDDAAILPIVTLCNAVRKNSETNALNAISIGQRLMTDGLALLKDTGIEIGSSAHAQARDSIALTMMQCAVVYGNATSKWAPCITLLEQAVRIVADPDMRSQIAENLRIVKSNHVNFGDLKPINSSPFLGTINAIGFTLYGDSDRNSVDDSYLSTYYFVFLAIPIFPIARYRVISIGNGYRFLGKAPFRPVDYVHLAVPIIAIFWMFSNG